MWPGLRHIKNEDPHWLELKSFKVKGYRLQISHQIQNKYWKDPFRWRAAPLFPPSRRLHPVDISLHDWDNFPPHHGNFTVSMGTVLDHEGKNPQIATHCEAGIAVQPSTLRDLSKIFFYSVLSDCVPPDPYIINNRSRLGCQSLCLDQSVAVEHT